MVRLSYLLLFVLLLTVHSLAGHNTNHYCNQILDTVKDSINQRLAGANLPTLVFECIRGGKQISVDANTVNIIELDTNMSEDPNYLDISAKAIYSVLRGSYRDLDGNGKLTNTRHTKNPFLDSTTVKKLKHAWRLNVGVVVPNGNPNDTIGARIVGPLATIQASEDMIYVVVGLYGWDSYIETDFLRESYILAANRSNGEKVWVANYTYMSTMAARRIAHSYPDQFNVTKVDQFYRSNKHGAGGFGPLVLTDDDIIFVAESSVTHELLTDNYFAGIPDEDDPDIKGFPQANGGPIIKEGWAVDNNIRHYIRGAIIAIDAKTGDFLGADKLLDYGEGSRIDLRGPQDRSAQGMVSVFQGGRMPKVYTYAGQRHVACGITMLDVPQAEMYMRTNYELEHIIIAELNGNIQRHYGGLKDFIFTRNSSGVFFEENFRRYAIPRMLFEGDTNPFNPNEVFANDTRASEYNYNVDGCWGQGIYANQERGLLIFTCANGKYRPVEEILAGWNAPSSCEPSLGACSCPNCTYYQFRKEAAQNVKTPKDLQQWHARFMLTARDRQMAIDAMSPRAREYLANSVVAVYINNGSIAWVHHHTPSDTWQSVNFQFDLDLSNNEMPLFNQYQLLFEGGDDDYGYGPIYSEKYDTIIVNAKDGTLEVLDIDTGNVISSTRTGFPTIAGTNNYGNTLVDKEMFVVSFNADHLGYDWGPLYHETSLSSSGLPNITFPDPTENGDDILFVPFPTDKAIGDGGKQKRTYDPNSYVLMGIDIHTGKIKRTRTINNPDNIDPDILNPFSLPSTSVNDVIIVPTGFDSSLRMYNAKTLEKLFDFNGFDDLQATGSHLENRTFVYANSVAIPVGYQVFWPHGEVGFQGASKGRYVHCFELIDP